MLICNSKDICNEPNCDHTIPHNYQLWCHESICKNRLAKCIEIELLSFEVLEDGSIKDNI